nr:MAG TPA: hypothetical protein [Caudoviricetes sp.]DAQ87051.1 MAG TPA: hypothetical protein [Caudoviricetes sp.]DAV14736.1 MAG TPA: hypothetical protein [Caudoviricetes sp.]DAV15137.1 MAG TPA: hypothetical protein [Caudoviricetes sp.]DAW13989.1 MAG TPA: hypothetical protein [Caudoviricetes sp.]
MTAVNGTCPAHGRHGVAKGFCHIKTPSTAHYFRRKPA